MENCLPYAPQTALENKTFSTQRKARTLGRSRGISGEGIPNSLIPEIEAALRRKDGKYLMFRLLTDPAGFLGTLWASKNQSVDADFLTQSLLVPLSTLAQMIDDGCVTKICELNVAIEQVLTLNGKKFSCRSYRKQHPKLGYGKRQVVSDSENLPDLFVDMPPTVEKVDTGGRPDEIILGSELAQLIREITASIDPLKKQVFDAVQEFRLTYGVSGAYPHVASQLITDADSNPVGLNVKITCKTKGPKPPKRLVNTVRKIFWEVRQIFETKLSERGYAIPVAPRKISKRRTK